MDGEGEEGGGYAVYGTPLEWEEDIARKKRRQAVESGRARNLPPWQQEVVDENGRRRFHGAFTGGFSAGYFNTVGSKEGWTPKTFTSSRKKRAEVSAQTAYDFMDEDEKEDLDYKELGATSEFDTFGFTKAEIARRQATEESRKRPMAIPEFLPDEIIVPVSESIGIKLLLKMGWRHGHSIGPRHIAAHPDVRREARKAFLALTPSDNTQGMRQKVYGAEGPPGKADQNLEDEDSEIVVQNSTPVYVINPKNDSYGLGFDPYKNAPEFRERKMKRLDGNSKEKTSIQKTLSQERRVSHPSLFRPDVGKMGGGFGIGALESLDVEDEDIYTIEAGIEVESIQEEEMQPIISQTSQRSLLPNSKQGVLSGFKPASISECKVERFLPPVVPPDFDPVHKFSSSLHSEKMLLRPPPPEVAPPEDPRMLKIIEGLATFVARSGQQFEDLSREKNKDNPMFQFLFGGNGSGFYQRKLWEEQKKITEQGKGAIFSQAESKATNLDSEKRGRILGETPLMRAPTAIAPEDRARLQSVLLDTFTKPLSESSEKSSHAAVPESGKPAQVVALETKTYPQREEQPWRPAPLLCKRFNLLDPYAGKPPPLPKPRSRMSSLILVANPVGSLPEASVINNNQVPSVSTIQEPLTQQGETYLEEQAMVEAIIEKPVDLYKAIFSDDSDEDEEIDETRIKQQEKNAQAAQTALNRLEAEDFLESLGKKLGLKVPPLHSGHNRLD